LPDKDGAVFQEDTVSPETARWVGLTGAERTAMLLVTQLSPGELGGRARRSAP
jgi:hypothetical protein